MYNKTNLLKVQKSFAKARESYVGPPHFRTPPIGRKAFRKIFTTRLDMHRFFGKYPTAFISICAVTSSYAKSKQKVLLV